MAPPEYRRHTILASDREVAVMEKALRCYATVMQIQTAAPSKREADDNVHAHAAVAAHMHCKCPVPQE